MSDKRARFIGHPDGVEGLEVPLDNGETRRITVPHGGEVPTEIDGHKVPAAFRDSLLEQKDNWTSVQRATGGEATGKKDAGDKNASGSSS